MKVPLGNLQVGPKKEVEHSHNPVWLLQHPFSEHPFLVQSKREKDENDLHKIKKYKQKRERRKA